MTIEIAENVEIGGGKHTLFVDPQWKDKEHFYSGVMVDDKGRISYLVRTGVEGFSPEDIKNDKIIQYTHSGIPLLLSPAQQQKIGGVASIKTLAQFLHAWFTAKPPSEHMKNKYSGGIVEAAFEAAKSKSEEEIRRRALEEIKLVLLDENKLQTAEDNLLGYMEKTLDPKARQKAVAREFLKIMDNEELEDERVMFATLPPDLDKALITHEKKNRSPTPPNGGDKTQSRSR